mmetsp:Transcript_48839/g.140189  ORF Transcript_48839/g.140189 Transcript_48839/m.140189 type:complete len:203 (-) Transcript_48839:321-929(-)
MAWPGLAWARLRWPGPGGLPAYECKYVEPHTSTASPPSEFCGKRPDHMVAHVRLATEQMLLNGSLASHTSQRPGAPLWQIMVTHLSACSIVQVDDQVAQLAAERGFTVLLGWCCCPDLLGDRNPAHIRLRWPLGRWRQGLRCFRARYGWRFLREEFPQTCRELPCVVILLRKYAIARLVPDAGNQGSNLVDQQCVGMCLCGT